MIFEDYFRNPNLYKEIADYINSENGLNNSFQIALEQISTHTDFKKALGLIKTSEMSAFAKVMSDVTAEQGQPQLMQKLITPIQTAVVGSALLSGFKFDGVSDRLLHAYEPVLTQNRELTEIQYTVSELIRNNNGFENRLKTAVYAPTSGILRNLPNTVDSMNSFQKAVASIKSMGYDDARAIVDQAGLVGNIVGTSLDTSWLKEVSPWQTTINSFSQIDNVSKNVNNVFTKLLVSENQTALLLGSNRFNTVITSVATQIASIVESGSIQSHGLAKMVSDYGGFALSQHKDIQDALNEGRDDIADWRLKLLDVTSKFVDRQVKKSNEIEAVFGNWNESTVDSTLSENVNAISEIEQQSYDKKDSEILTTEILLDAVGVNDLININDDKSMFTAVPQEIGYTRRDDVSISQEEALEKSKTVTITELGFKIVDRIIEVNQLQDILLKDTVFRPTVKTMKTIGNLGRFICDDEVKFEKMIKSIYSLIYENQNGIKTMLGDGDSDVGDRLIRGKEYECMFRIKDIRTDLEHDVEHGGESKYKKKQEEIKNAYLFYAKKKPTTAREFKNFQIKLYEDVIDLIDGFIMIINNRIKTSTFEE